MKRGDAEGRKGEARAGLPSTLVASLTATLLGSSGLLGVRTSCPYTPEGN